MMTGVVGSGLAISLTIFVTEISNDKWVPNRRVAIVPLSSDDNLFFSCGIRGTLNSVFDPFLNLGVVFSLFLGKSFNYVDQAKYQLIFPILFLLLFVWVPESPQHLINIQKEKVHILVESWSRCIHMYLFIEIIFRPRINHTNSLKELNWKSCQYLSRQTVLRKWKTDWLYATSVNFQSSAKWNNSYSLCFYF